MGRAHLTPICTMLRGKDRMLRISVGMLDGRHIIDIALLLLNGSDTGRGIAFETQTLPALLMALEMAGAAAADFAGGKEGSDDPHAA